MGAVQERRIREHFRRHHGGVGLCGERGFMMASMYYRYTLCSLVFWDRGLVTFIQTRGIYAIKNAKTIGILPAFSKSSKALSCFC